MEMYKLFFGSQEMCPDLTEDAGLSCNRADTQVSSPAPGHAIRTFIVNFPFKELSLEQEWIAKAKLIRCPAPLPETTPDPVLTKIWRLRLWKRAKGGTGKLLPPQRRLSRKGGSRIPPSRGRRGPLLKIRRPRPQSGGRNLHQRVLRQEKPQPHYFPKGISPPASRKYKGEFCNKGHASFFF